MVLLCCGGVAVIGALAGEPDPIQRVAPAADEQLADAAPAATPTSASTSAPTSATPAPAAPSPTTAAPGEAAPVVEKRTVVERQSIRYATRRVEDDAMDKGETRVRTKGVAGVRTLTYEVTYTDGDQTGKRLVSSTVTRKPVTRVVAVGTRVSEPSGGGDCAPGYSPCVPVAEDVDCAGGSGNGPEYVSGPIRVTGSDPYDLDRDGDGIACDT